MIVSIAPEIGLDEGNTYAGGLGVLEGDKFYCASLLGVLYTVLTLFYRNGYVEYEFDKEGNIVSKPQPQPEEFLKKLVREDSFIIKLRNEQVKVETLRYCLGSSEVRFFNVMEPEWASRLTSRLYIEEGSEERFYKYTLLAKASAEYMKRFMKVSEISYIDLQEAYACILPIILKIPGKYRLVIHTAGPWGHPSFPREFFEREFGYKFISPNVTLTEVGLAVSEEAFAVSAKHFDIMSRIIPHFTSKLRYVTNGVCTHRWMDAELREYYVKGEAHMEQFIKIREKINKRFAEFIRSYKDVDVKDRLVAVWCRRMVPYKRPDFVIKAIHDVPKDDVLFILGGKAHPQDRVGLEYMRAFYKLHENFENVVYIPNYSINEAKMLFKAADLLLFTPYPGWEACGTSYMKAAINGVPTLASPDGGIIELIVNEVNGWLFGEDVRELIALDSPEADEINKKEYTEFRDKLLRIASMYKGYLEKYYKVSLNALHTFIHKVGMERVLREYYQPVLKRWYT